MRWAASPTDGRRLSEGKRSRSWLRLRELPLRVSQPSTPSDLKSHESSRTCHIGQNPMRATSSALSHTSEQMSGQCSRQSADII